MFYTVYKITNLVNGKIYIGVHKTDDLNDDYMGSGKYLKHAQEKYGIENFVREYLHVFDNAEDMFEMESELVNEEFVARDDTYNLRIGGHGGWDYINSSGLNLFEGHREQARKNLMMARAEFVRKLKEDLEFRQKYCEKHSAILKKRILESGALWTGRTHSDDSKKKIGEKNAIHQKGNRNSQFGKMWITNPDLKESKRIYKDEPLPEGWVKGRKQYRVNKEEGRGGKN